MNCAKKLKHYLIANKLNISEGASTESIKCFEKEQQVLLPIDFRSYFLEMNGVLGYEVDLEHLAKLWPIEKICLLTDKLFLHEKYIEQGEADLTEHDSALVYSALPEDDFHSLRSPAKKSFEGNIIEHPKWLLPESEKFFIFGDYNIEANFWAIKLSGKTNTDNTIIAVYDYSNLYRVVANNFAEFVEKYVDVCPEALI